MSFLPLNNCWLLQLNKHFQSTIYRTVMLKGILYIYSRARFQPFIFYRLAFILMFNALSLALQVKHLNHTVNEFYRLPLSVFHDGLERRETAHVHKY